MSTGHIERTRIGVGLATRRRLRGNRVNRTATGGVHASAIRQPARRNQGTHHVNELTAIIIIAEDDGLMRSLLRSMLIHSGRSIFLAADGGEAVALARRVVAQLVILDLRMPRMNGLRACEVIRQLPNYGTVPIAILTSMLTHDAAEAARRAGATAIFHKPIKPATLLRGLAPFLGEAPIPGRPLPAAAMTGQVSADLDLPVGQVWQRVHAPPPVFDEQEELSRGRKMLEVYRR